MMIKWWIGLTRKKIIEFEDLNTAALCVVGAMTFVVIEPLNPSRNVMFDQNYKDYFVKQIAEFCVNAVQVQEEKA